jgi:hypothetical protein
VDSYSRFLTQLDLQFVKEFLLTYRLFMSPGVLLQYLIERYGETVFLF